VDFSTAPAGNPGTSGSSSGGGESPLTYGGDGPDGSTFQGDGSYFTVQPPENFSSSNCNLTYPFSSATPASNVVFNESDVLYAFSPQGNVVATPGLTVSVWYIDEHAMTLGIRQVVVKTLAGSTTTNYSVSANTASPGMILNPSVGTTVLTGDHAGTDTSTCSGAADNCARPIYPAMFVTDTTANSSSLTGDWQFGGKPVLPHAVFGSWKSAVRIVDKTGSTTKIQVLPDADPPQNNLNLGGIAAPVGVQNEGFSSVVSWEVSRLGLKSGHSYRLQFMVHDGDQNKTGGDAGQNCVNIQIP
jgi:hypothetical protein